MSAVLKNKLALRSSLSVRLLLVFLLTSLFLTVLVVVTVVHGFASAWNTNARPHLELYLDYISEDIGEPPSEARALALSEKLPVHIYISGPNTDFSTSGERLDTSEFIFVKPGRKHRGRHRQKTRFPHNNGAFANVEFAGNADKTLLKRDLGEYQVYYELSHRNKERNRHRFIMPILFGLLATLGLLYFVIRKMLQPVRDIRAGVSEMSKGDLSHRIKIRRNNDLGALAGSINTMASDIEKLLDSKRQLLLGASHELRTPLTRAVIATQLLPESSERQQIEDDLREMTQLTTDILESERMKSGHAILDIETVNIDELINSVLMEMQANDVRLEITEPLPGISLDRTRMRILLRNLVGNALAHSLEGQESVKIQARLIGREVGSEVGNEISDVIGDEVTNEVGNNLELRVSDNGPGIAHEHIGKLTEPFYRADESRTRQTGGFGLGLHLAKLIAEAHNGSLSIQSLQVGTGSSSAVHASVDERPHGTTVIVTLPTHNKPIT